MLEELNLSNGSIIDPPFLNTRVIRKLNLSYNRISLLWDECMPRGIVELDLQENYISSDGLLVDWPNSIEVLNLSKNQFTTLEHTLHWPNALRELNVSDTQLEEIYAEELPSTLEVLLLNKTNIYAIFYLPPALKRIEAYSSMLNLLPSTMPSTLEVVDFSNCVLHTLPVSWGDKLKVLNLAKNSLTEWPTGLPATLETLNLSRNYLGSVGEPPESLKVLNLCRNRIRKMPEWMHTKPILVSIADNCITVAQFPATVISSEGQWNLLVHSETARRIQKAWWRRQMRSRLRTWRRVAAIKWDLLAVAMSPDRAGIFQCISSEWHKRSD